MSQVPDTTTFTLQDVRDVVMPGVSNASLAQCFANANEDFFNPDYEGTKNRLLNFRDYGSHNAPVQTTLEINPTSMQFGSGGGVQNVTITFSPDIVHRVTIVANQTWINIVSTDINFSPETRDVGVGSNPTQFARFGSITFSLVRNSDNVVIQTQTLNITQDAQLPF